MPYITQQERDALDVEISALVAKLQDMHGDQNPAVDGPLNYTLCRILLGVVTPDRYRHYVRVLGTLEAVKLEIYRRLTAAYEDKAIKKNGDVIDFLGILEGINET